MKFSQLYKMTNIYEILPTSLNLQKITFSTLLKLKKIRKLCQPHKQKEKIMKFCQFHQKKKKTSNFSRFRKKEKNLKISTLHEKDKKLANTSKTLSRNLYYQKPNHLRQTRAFCDLFQQSFW